MLDYIFRNIDQIISIEIEKAFLLSKINYVIEALTLPRKILAL